MDRLRTDHHYWIDDAMYNKVLSLSNEEEVNFIESEDFFSCKKYGTLLTDMALFTFTRAPPLA